MNITHLFALTYPGLTGAPAMRSIERPPYRAVLAVQRSRQLFGSAPFWEASVRRGRIPLYAWTRLDFYHAWNLARAALADAGRAPTQNRSVILELRIVRPCADWELALYHPNRRNLLDRQPLAIVVQQL